MYSKAIELALYNGEDIVAIACCGELSALNICLDVVISLAECEVVLVGGFRLKTLNLDLLGGLYIGSLDGYLLATH